MMSIISMKRKSDSIASVMTSSSSSSSSRRVKVDNYFADLPSSVITHILLQVPIKDIFACKCVCTTWNALILDPYFVKLYSEHASPCLLVRTGTNDSSLVSNDLHLIDHLPPKFQTATVNFDPQFKLPFRNPKTTIHFPSHNPMDDKFDVVNSCNGLLCLCEPNAFFRTDSPRDELRSVNNLVVCNPITGEFIRLPEAADELLRSNRIPISAGLGFEPKINEYKVIRLWKWKHLYKPNTVVVEMHTIGTRTWRNIEFDPMISFSRLESPTSVNGALHWINFDNEKLSSILSIDLESERFQSFSCPSSPSSDVINIVELKGFLYLCEKIILPNTWSVWLMKEYGNVESWTKVFCTDNNNIIGDPYDFRVCKPIKHFENGCGALLFQLITNRCPVSFCYEPDKGRVAKFTMRKGPLMWFESILHIPSLISLKDLAKGNKLVKVQNVDPKNMTSPCYRLMKLDERIGASGKTPYEYFLWFRNKSIK